MKENCYKYKRMREMCYLILKGLLRFEIIEETGFIEQQLQRVEKILEFMPKEDVDVFTGFIEKNINPMICNPNYFDFLKEASNCDMATYLKYEKVLELNEALDNVANSLTIFLVD